MSTTGSVTHWIDRLKAGDDRAAQALWERYCKRLLPMARANLRGASRRVADEEDVLISAFDSFCRGAQTGKFPDLNDRDDLWRLLVVMTTRKALNQRKRFRRLKRGGGRVRGESAFADGNHPDAIRHISQIIGDEPTPEFAGQLAELVERLLDGLDDETLQNVAIWKMDGHTNREIAEKLECSIRTVARKLRIIRKQLQQELADD